MNKSYYFLLKEGISAMDMLEFALEQEHKIEKHYRDMARRAPHEGIKNILEMLTANEQHHENVIQQMKQEVPIQERQVDFIKGADSILTKLTCSTEYFGLPEDELFLYQQARDIEYQKEQTYHELAARSLNVKQRRIFEGLAAEEHQHYVLMGNLCDLLERTHWFLEDAEFSHIPDYAEGVF